MSTRIFLFANEIGAQNPGSDSKSQSSIPRFPTKVLPMSMPLSRRNFIGATAATMAATSLASPRPVQASADIGSPFRLCLNTSTVRECQYKGKKIDIIGEIEIAAKAGYTGNEPWIGEIDAYVKGGGVLSDLRKRIADAGQLMPVLRLQPFPLSGKPKLKISLSLILILTISRTFVFWWKIPFTLNVR